MSGKCLEEGFDYSMFWKIECISLWNEVKQDIFSSKTFYAATLYGSRWNLHLKRNKEKEYFDLLLIRDDQDDGPEEIQTNLSLHVFYNKKVYSKLIIKEVLTIRKGGSFTFQNILTQDEIFNCSSLRSWDTPLTLQCFLTEPVVRMPQVCKSVTEVDVERVSFVWKTSTSAEDLQRLSINAISILSHAPPLDISIYSSDGNGEKLISFEFDAQKVLGNKERLFVVCQITLLSDSGKNNHNHSLQCLHSFKSVEESLWKYPLSFNVRNFEEEFCKSLTFSFDLQFSYGKFTFKMEHSRFITNCKTSQSVNCFHSEDFLPMYNDGHFFNVTLRVGDKTFSAHKDILCIRSPVFKRAILEDAGAQEIPVKDLDPEALNIFLTFLYTSMPLELMQSKFLVLVGDNWTRFKKLHSAAIKYEVANLQNVCSIFLASNINPEIALECMKIAELHNDNFLKAATHEYFTFYASAIMNSDAFKSLLRLS